MDENQQLASQETFQRMYAEAVAELEGEEILCLVFRIGRKPKNNQSGVWLLVSYRSTWHLTQILTDENYMQFLTARQRAWDEIIYEPPERFSDSESFQSCRRRLLHPCLLWRLILCHVPRCVDFRPSTFRFHGLSLFTFPSDCPKFVCHVRRLLMNKRLRP
jgi:hypothetical protein